MKAASDQPLVLVTYRFKMGVSADVQWLKDINSMMLLEKLYAYARHLGLTIIGRTRCLCSVHGTLLVRLCRCT